MTLLLLLAPLAALSQAQEEPGLDLSEPPPSQTRPEKAPLPPPPPGAKPGDAGSAKPATPREEAPLAPGERDVALGDRVKAVQLKGFLKRRRLELGLNFPGTVNDAFYEKLGVGGKLAYNFEDSFALAVRGSYFWQIRSAHVREGQAAFSSQILTSRVNGQAMLDGIWSPVYGKVAWLGSQIVHFDMYLLAGLGSVWSATSSTPRGGPFPGGGHAAAEVGGGIRFYPNSWLALDAGVIGTLYPDQPIASAPSTVQKLIVAQLGFAVFFPFSFEYAHP